MKTPQGEITRLIEEMRGGDESARQRLWEAVYQELQQIARYRMRGEREGHTLSTTGLVHEAYFKLMGPQTHRLNNSQHFFAFASHVMREVLIDYARKAKAQRRNGGIKPEPLENAADEIGLHTIFGTLSPEQFIDLYDALEALKVLNPTWATVVECRFFGGMTFREIAEIIGYDTRTAERYWQRARSWLFTRMSGKSIAA
ncbi:MAG: ECF-type sigma factor [Bacteroidota bacterium]